MLVIGSSLLTEKAMSVVVSSARSESPVASTLADDAASGGKISSTSTPCSANQPFCWATTIGTASKSTVGQS